MRRFVLGLDRKLDYLGLAFLSGWVIGWVHEGTLLDGTSV